eukprot:scaffold1353_cov161-Amphora_coffeaeformis.AAC.9
MTIPENETIVEATRCEEGGDYGSIPTAHAVPINDDDVLGETTYEAKPLIQDATSMPHGAALSPASSRQGLHSDCESYLCCFACICFIPLLVFVVCLIPSSPAEGVVQVSRTPLVPTLAPVLPAVVSQTMAPVSASSATVVVVSPSTSPQQQPVPVIVPEPSIADDDDASGGGLATLDMPRGGAVMDKVQMLDPDWTYRIVQEIRDVQRDVPGCEIQMVVASNIPSGSFASSKEFATALFNQWRLGSATTNNVVLILFLQEPHRIEVEVGAALDSYMNNAWTTSMLQRRAVPEFRQGNFGIGLYQVVVSCADRLRDIQAGIASPYTTRTTPAVRPASRAAQDPAQMFAFAFSGCCFLCVMLVGIHGGGSSSGGSSYESCSNDDYNYGSSSGGGGGGSSTNEGGGFSTGDGGGGASW